MDFENKQLINPKILWEASRNLKAADPLAHFKVNWSEEVHEQGVCLC